MQKAETKYLFSRNGTFYFRRIIPKDRWDFNEEGKRKRELVHSLNTKSLTEALPRLAEFAQYYDNVLSFIPDISAQITIPAVRDRAKQCGTVYSHVDAVVTAHVPESIDALGPYLEIIGQVSNPDPILIAAAGGVVEPPAMTMHQALEQFETNPSDMWLNLGHREHQKKWNKYREAVTDFEKEMGADLDILKLTKKQVYEYRAKLLDRVKDKLIKVDTVRKKLMWLRVIVRHAYELDDRKGEDSPFENLRPIKGIGDEEKRPPILNDEAVAIRKHFDEVGADPEMVAICAVLENAGAHAMEIVKLAKEDIILDAEIPHLLIRPNEHRSMLKTDNRIRKVPLVGIALKAMKRFPDGFPSFCRDNGNGKLSDAANHLIQQVAPGKTTYGYRHRMADLMKAKKYEYSFRTAILGQSDGKKRIGDHYGTEYPLEIKLEILTNCLPPEAS